MRINHLIVGTDNLESSSQFYMKLFDFIDDGVFVDTGSHLQGRVLTMLTQDEHLFQLLLVPFGPEKLPNPQHIAFEVDASKFEKIYQNSKKLGLKIRSQPALDSDEDTILGHLAFAEYNYRNFYILDPANTNVEVMTKK